MMTHSHSLPVEPLFRVGDRVTTGKAGTVVAIFLDRSGNKLLVVENDDGLLEFFNPNQLLILSPASVAAPF